MKKFIICLIACVSMVQSAYAATSALTESLLEYEAITSGIGTNPSFENIIPVTEFIVDIKRITKQINVLGTVKYEILTLPVSDGSIKKKQTPIKYIAILDVSPNPGVGPNIVTLISIVLVQPNKHHHHH